jgi:hypothetical protein
MHFFGRDFVEFHIFSDKICGEVVVFGYFLKKQPSSIFNSPFSIKKLYLCTLKFLAR